MKYAPFVLAGGLVFVLGIVTTLMFVGGSPAPNQDLAQNDSTTNGPEKPVESTTKPQKPNPSPELTVKREPSAVQPVPLPNFPQSPNQVPNNPDVRLPPNSTIPGQPDPGSPKMPATPVDPNPTPATVNPPPPRISVICAKSIEFDPKSLKPAFVYPASLPVAADKMRFLVPVRKDGKLQFDLRFDLPTEDAAGGDSLKFNLALDGSTNGVTETHLRLALTFSKADQLQKSPESPNAVTRMTIREPDQEKAGFVRYCGMLIDGTPPNLMLFRSPPLRTAALASAETGVKKPVVLWWFNTSQLKEESAGNFAATSLLTDPIATDLLRCRDFVVNLPEIGRISLEQDGDGGNFHARLADAVFGKSVELKLAPATAANKKSPAPLNWDIKLFANGKDLAVLLNQDVNDLQKRWRTLFDELPPGSGLRGAENMSIDIINQTLGMVVQVDGSQTSTAQLPEDQKRFYLELRDLRKRLQDATKHEERRVAIMKNIQLVSGRVFYRVAVIKPGEQADKDAPGFDIDVITIGDMPTELDYYPR